MADEFASYAEHIVKKECRGQYLTKRILLITVCTLFAVGAPLLTLTVPALNILVTAIPVFVVIGFGVMWILFPFVDIEYEYRVCGGVFTVEKILGQKLRRPYIECNISDMEIIAPNNEEFSHFASAADIETVYDCSSAVENDGVYFAVYKDRGGRKCLVYFDMTEKIHSLMKSRNRVAMRTAKY